MIGMILIVFLVVYLLNLVPAFAPPTWMVFSFLGFRHPDLNVPKFALAGALAATLGRATLAKLARVIIRQRFLSQRTRDNIDSIKQRLDQHRKFTFGVFLLYAFGPLPSNYLFIAYGLTTMDLGLILVPFFIGRAVSYSFWGVTSAIISRHVGNAFGKHPMGYLSVYFVLTQIFLLYLVYLFTRVDWRLLLDEKKFRLLPRNARSRTGTPRH
jgi:membrane protein YqaA with SNARE-associated domain